MLESESPVLMIVDVQGKLAQLMHEKEALFRNLEILIGGAQILEIPILWVEQNPTGLGPTVPQLAQLLAEQKRYPKMTFSACGEPTIMEALRQTGRREVWLAGIEAHVCIYLTAVDLLSRGYQVEVVADAVSSRSPDARRIGLEKVASLGGGITCTETALFEQMGQAGGAQFKQVVRLLK